MTGIYQVDPYLLQYRTNVKGFIEDQDKTGILFEETIFYPEGGGQPSDRGTLVCDARRTSHEVLHVEQRPEGIVHWIAGSLKPTIGASVLLTVDAERRQDHMQQHHGQHILSAVFERNYGWDTVGFHLGPETSTIDLTVGDISQDVLQEVELEVNRIIMENIPVKTEYYKREDLGQELIKKLPSDQNEVRLVVIPGIDENACCGTHPQRTGEVGPCKILKIEKLRGNIRLSFICGERTIAWMRQTADTLHQLEKAIGASGNEALIRLEKREVELKKLQKERKELLSLKYRYLAKELATEAISSGETSILIQHFSEADMEMLRGVATSWCAQSGRVAVLMGGTGPFDVVMARGSGVATSMNSVAAELWPVLEGKGGGSAELVQGKAQKLPVEQLKEMVASAINRKP
ncbi:phage tail protein I [Desulforamulus reducens MI-1]|uniref:Phage tail protein I n=1 Tax=Desulforamulus reducens (strain ATCC BAA-1160 / DSM 100696 / MI-1) TaxID=349161 RepID=A4J6Z0_DESRM|nr:alanine--tRNA ligase-related protein [Desulforamulus reducens]ABO50843.1 phage tail protein I [Desulforamulus reducens MI-1]